MKNHEVNEPKCSNCKFYHPQYIMAHTPEFDKCTHPEVVLHRNNISDDYRTFAFCNIERDKVFEIIHVCGYTGKLFKPASKIEKIKKHLSNGLLKNIPLYPFYVLILYIIL